MNTDNDFHFMHDIDRYDVQNFKILDHINEGAFGSVILVQEKSTLKIFAAKIIKRNKNCKKSYEELVNREVENMIKCKNPTIIEIYGYSLTDFDKKDNVTIFMKYAQNGSLRDFLSKIKEGLSDDSYNITILQIILVGISYGMMILHNNHIIHRDLKPENILLDEKFYPFITDFGFSKLQEPYQMKQSMQCGTLMYMAPEIKKGIEYDEKVDVYSFGAMMFEIVEGSDPCFTLENYRPEFKGKSKPFIQQLIEMCLSLDPKKRPTFQEIFLKLAYNFDKNNENDNDFEKNRYYLDGVDLDQVIMYAEEINNSKNEIVTPLLLSEMKTKYETKIQSLKETLRKVEEENEEIKKKSNHDHIKMRQNQISIKDFNSLNLHVKLYIISTILNDYSIPYLTQIDNLLQYFEGLILNSANTNCEIITCNQEQSLNKIEKNEQIFINHNTTDILYQNDSFESQDFINIISKFSSVLIEIKFPTIAHHNIYQKVLTLKKSLPDIIQIGFLISEYDQISREFNKIDFVKFDTTVKQIVDFSFTHFTKLKQVILSDSIELIGEEAFRDCKSIEKMTIPLSVHKIGNCAFKSCSALVTIEIPSSVTEIGEACFIFCKSLKYIKIPSSITKIKMHTFKGCDSLEQVEIPKSVKKISEEAFNDCPALEQITISSRTTVDKKAFSKNTHKNIIKE